MLHRRALAPVLTIALTAGGVTLNAAPAVAEPRLSVAAVERQGPLDGLVATVLPFISGSGLVGESLSLALPEWSLPGVSNTVQWFANGAPIPGATQTTFTPGAAQAGTEVHAVVTGTVDLLLATLSLPVLSNYVTIPLPGGGGSGGGGGGGTEDPVTVVQDPSLTGIPGVGSLLGIINPVWSVLGLTSTYQWFVDGIPVPGATDPTYTPSIADGGKQVHAVVTGLLAGVPVVSALTNFLPIPAATAEPLAATSAATVTGTAKVGKVVSVTDPTWNTEDVTHAYQWLRDGAPIAGATAKTYTLAPEDLGRRIVVKVTGSKEGWTDSTVDSQDVTPTVGDAITFTTQPSVSGTPALGKTLTALPGTWGQGSTPTFGYQWRRGGQVIVGATSPTYAVTADDLGSTLSVTVTATRAAYDPGTFTTSNLSVAKLASATTIKGKKKVRAGKPLRVLLGVVVDGFAPDGVLTVMDGSTTLKKTRIAKGRKKLKLPKLAPGKHRIVAVYAGSDATESSRSKVLKLRVLPRR